MSKIKCSACGAWINDTADKCSTCHAVNLFKKKIVNKPKTIDELNIWISQNEDKIRYSSKENEQIGDKNKFGVYKENDNFIAYGVDRFGQKTILYKGNDEDYAVNIIYIRLKEDIVAQNTLVDFEENQLLKSNPYTKLSIYAAILTVEIIALYFVLIVPFDYYFLSWFVF